MRRSRLCAGAFRTLAVTCGMWLVLTSVAPAAHGSDHVAGVSLSPSGGGKGLDTPASKAGLTPYDKRVTDEAIAEDLRLLSSWQTRLEALDVARPPRSLYHRVKAEAWLAFARDEYAANDRSGAAEAALEEAVRLIRKLEIGDTSLTWQTAMIGGASKLRDSHWALTERVKHKPEFRCVEVEVAMLEIELVRAGHEQHEGFPCWAEDRLKAADLLADSVKTKAERCRPRPVVVVPPAPTPAEIKSQIERLPKFVHFALDSASLSKRSRAVLDTIARVLVAIPQIKVQLEGNADRRAGQAYNLALSKRRVFAVRDFLARAGVDRERMQVFYYGKTRPRVAGENVQAFARNRNVIFHFIPPAAVKVEEVHQEQDIQLETPRTPRPKPTPKLAPRHPSGPAPKSKP
ncbi:MAG: OmpA family protein [Candidatus Eisenbacteria bacterium]